MKGQRAIVDLTKIIRPKGLDPATPYPAVVVDDNDPDRLDRIRARVPLMMDHIKDSDLPWAYPIYNQLEGLKGGQDLDRSGRGHIPRKGNKVSLHFPTADPSSVFYGGVPVDKQNQLPEMRKNYPNRIVFKFKSGLFVIHDTKTYESFITFPGDVHQLMMGDLNTTVVGQHSVRVVDKAGSKDGVWAKQSDMVSKDLKPRTASQLQFEGLLGKGAGNQHHYVKKNQTIQVEESLKIKVKKDYLLDVQGKINLKSGSTLTEKATKIDMN